MNIATMKQQPPVWPFGVVLIVGAFVLTPVLIALAGTPLWMMPVFAFAALGWSIVQPHRAIFGVPLVRLRMILVGLVAVTLIQASVISDTLKSNEVVATAREIVSLGKTDPEQQASALAKADDEMLAVIGRIEPALKDGEIARRNAAKAAANAPRIAELIAQGRKLDKDDVEGRLAIWRKLVSLAPGEAGYRTALAELEEKQAHAERIRAHPEEGVEVVAMNWHKGGFGSVMILDITLRNDSSIELRDFVINCEHSGPSGTVMDRNSRTLYEKLAAGEKRRFRDVHMGFIHSQVAASSCEVRGAKAE